MTQDSANTPATPTASATTERQSYTAVIVVTAIVLAAHAWALWQQAINNWHHELYSFFPLIILGAGLIAWHRRTELARHQIRPASGPIPFVSGLVCLSLLAFSIRMQSPWPGALSAIIALRAVLRWGLGVKAASVFAPVWWFLLLALPLPMGADRELVVWMQLEASRVASGVLDLIGYRHDLTGVYLMFPGYTFEVEDACSGIQSFYAAVSCVALYMILNGRGAGRTLLTLLLSAGWVFLANVGRIVFVCVAVIKWDLPVSSGMGHELVGIASFAAALLLSFSTDRCLLFLIPPAKSVEAFSTGGRRWSLFRRRSETAAQSSPRMAALFGGLLVTSFAALTAWQIPSILRAREAWFQNLDPMLLSVETDFLPAEVQGWELVDFELISRESRDEFGQTSRVWTYEMHNLTVKVSLDGPFTAWHDLAKCYGTLGWKTLEETDHFGTDRRYTEFVQEQGFGESDENVSTLVEADSVFSRQMFGLFAAFTEAGDEIAPPPLVRWGLGSRFPQLTTAFARLLAEAREGASSDRNTRQPVYQLQVVYQADGVITVTEQETIRQFFSVVHRLVLKKLEERSLPSVAVGNEPER